MASILLVQSDPVRRARAVESFRHEPACCVCGAVDSLARARATLAWRTPDVLIADVVLPDGALRELLAELPTPRRLRVLALARSPRDPQLDAAAAVGIDGCLAVTAPTAALLELTRRLVDDESTMTPDVARRFLASGAARVRGLPLADRSRAPIEADAFELLQAIAAAESETRIAAKRGISLRQLGRQVRGLYRALGGTRRVTPVAGCR